MLEGLQVKTRHWAVDPETGEHLETNSEMATKAVREALDLAGMKAGDMDLLVVSTTSPEYHLPPTSTLVKENLGREELAAIDMRSGCAGAVEALDLARLQLERGDYETAVVVGSEHISPLSVPIFVGKDPDKVRMRDRLGIYSFGDGAGAMVLRDERRGRRDTRGVRARLRRRHAQAGHAGHRRRHATPVEEQRAAKRLIELKVDVVESGRFTPYVLTKGLQETLARAGSRRRGRRRTA